MSPSRTGLVTGRLPAQRRPRRIDRADDARNGTFDGMAAPDEALADPDLLDPVVRARLALARAMLRSAPPVDTVTFTARCPACGEDRQWQQERVDTRLRTNIDCTCS